MIDESIKNLSASDRSDREAVIKLHMLKIFHKIALKFG